jgi:hypothetical protein
MSESPRPRAAAAAGSGGSLAQRIGVTPATMLAELTMNERRPLPRLAAATGSGGSGRLTHLGPSPTARVSEQPPAVASRSSGGRLHCEL